MSWDRKIYHEGTDTPARVLCRCLECVYLTILKISNNNNDDDNNNTNKHVHHFFR